MYPLLRCMFLLLVGCLSLAIALSTVTSQQQISGTTSYHVVIPDLHQSNLDSTLTSAPLSASLGLLAVGVMAMQAMMTSARLQPLSWRCDKQRLLTRITDSWRHTRGTLRQITEGNLSQANPLGLVSPVIGSNTSRVVYLQE